ncbi:MAG: LCP family protein [Anaerolineales bacterium]|jgi:LCP family protein required for cell wall assembly
MAKRKQDPAKSFRSRTGLWLILSGTALIMIILGGLAFARLREFWQQPLGPSLGYASTPTFTYSPVSITQLPGEASEDVPPAKAPTLPSITNGPTPTPVSLPTFTPNAVCSPESEMILLAIGIDYRPGTYTYGLADVIRIVHVDFTSQRISVLSLPRDVWVEVPGISDHYGITHSKLNQSYFYGTPAMGYYDGPGGGAGLLARTLDTNFGLQPQHYGVVNMQVLIDMIDAIGGVDIYLWEELDARDSPQTLDQWKLYEQGWNHLDGREAVYYARIRKIKTPTDRIDRQTEILCAVKTKLLNARMIARIPDLISAFYENVLTDLSPEQISQLACLTPYLSAEKVVFARIPSEEFVSKTIISPNSNAKAYVLEVNKDHIRQYIDDFLAGTWPAESNEAQGQSPSTGDTGQLCPVYPSH